MTKYIGRRLQLGIARETERGTLEAPVYQLPVTTFSFDDAITKVRSGAGLGVIEDSEEAFITTSFGEGSFEGEIRADSFGLLLLALYGGYTEPTGADSNGLYEHVFDLEESNQHQSLSLVVRDPNTTEGYALSMLKTLEVKSELDEIVKYTTEFVSQRGVATAFTIPAIYDEVKFTKKHAFVKIAATVDDLEEAVELPVKSITLTQNTNAVLDDILGTAFPEDILNQQFSIEGEIMLLYQDETFKDYFTEGAVRAMEIKFVNGDEVIGVDGNESLSFAFYNVDFPEWTPEYALDEIVSQTISFKANVNTELNPPAALAYCKLVNTIPTYVAPTS